MLRHPLAGAPVLAAALLLGAAPAHADDPAAPATPAAPAPPAAWTDGITFGAQIEAGISGNPRQSETPTSASSSPTIPTPVLLNQVLLTVARDIPKDASGWDVGFRLQGMFGSDARYTHFLGIADYAIDQRTQLDVTEASVAVRVPVLQGLDLKVGLYPTPLGFETIDPSHQPVLFALLHLQLRHPAEARRRAGRAARHRPSSTSTAASTPA